MSNDEKVTRGNFTSAAEAVRKLEVQADYLLQAVPIMARIHRAAFDAYVTEGFTEAQALELVKAYSQQPQGGGGPQ